MNAPRFAPPPAAVVDADVAAALAEDIGIGDATAMLLDDAADSTPRQFDALAMAPRLAA